MHVPVSTAWAVRLRVGWAAYYFGWSPQHPTGYAAPLSAKRAPCLRFATETEAEVACEAYLGMSPDPYPADVVQVKASPTHRLTNAGFAPVPLAEAFPLFATSAQQPATGPGPVDNS